MMHYARDSLLKSFSASPSEYVVLPAGSGSTGAIEKTVRVLKRNKKNGRPLKFTSLHTNTIPIFSLGLNFTKTSTSFLMMSMGLFNFN